MNGIINKEQVSTLRVISSGRFVGASHVPFHAHLGAELVLLTQGTCSIGVAGKNLRAEQNGLFILPANTPHNQINHKFTKTSYVVFSNIPPWFSADARIIDTSADPQHFIYRWIDDLCDLGKSIPEEDPHVISGITLSLLRKIKQLEQPTTGPVNAHRAILRAHTFMNAHFTSAIDMKSIAQYAAVSPSHLSALFKKAGERPPLQQVQDARLALARRLLTGDYHTVAEIARQCGYIDPNYFCRLFKKKTRLSPLEFRSTR